MSRALTWDSSEEAVKATGLIWYFGDLRNSFSLQVHHPGRTAFQLCRSQPLPPRYFHITKDFDLKVNFVCYTFWNRLSWSGLSILQGAELEWVLLDQDVLWILCDLFGDINSNHQFLSCSEQMLWCSSGREGKAALHHLSWCDRHSAPTLPCALLRTLVSCCHWPDFSLQSSTQQLLQGWCSAQACLALLPVSLCFLPSSHFLSSFS